MLGKKIKFPVLCVTHFILSQVEHKNSKCLYEYTQSVFPSCKFEFFGLESTFASLKFRILIKVSTGRQRC